MSIKAKIIIDNTEINVAQFSFGFNQKADDNGRPFQKPVFVGLQLVIETRKDLNLADWAFASYKAKQLELHIYPAIMGGKTRKIYFYDCHLVNWNNHFLATGNYPMSETLHITAAGVKNSYSNTEYSAYWRETFPQQKIEPTVQEEDKEKKTPKILNGWWTSDKGGNKTIKQAHLGDTVYFHIRTVNIASGEKISLKLYDLDVSTVDEIFGTYFLDYLNPDDDEFDEQEVHKQGYVNSKGIATIELLLQESWENDLAADFAYNLELYWEATYKGSTKNVPKRKDDTLKVKFSERTLYFNLSTDGYNLPDMRSNDGSPLVYLKFITGRVTGKIQGKALDALNKKVEKAIHRIAIGKLEKGSLATSTGRIQTNANAGIYKKDTFTNEGELLKDLEKRKNWGNVTETTKGISQYDFFSKTGKRVKILGFLKEIGGSKKVNLFDIIDLFYMATDESDPFKQPLPDFGLGSFGKVSGSFALVWNVAGILVSQMKAEDDALMREVEQQDIEKAKLKGLEAVKKEIETYKYNKKYQWHLLPISKETANKLVQGEFKTFEEFEVFSLDHEPENEKIEILYRTIKNTNREEDIYIIETIFINE